VRTAAVIIATAGLALLAAACGGSHGNQVAQLGSVTTQGSASSTGSGGSSNTGGATHADALRYAQCMRSHGINDFPDPTASGHFAIHDAGPNSDLNRNNPTFRAADRACQRYSP
jgi:hypothetical protein